MNAQNKLRRDIIQIFQGIDIGVCFIDPCTYQIQYANDYLNERLDADKAYCYQRFHSRETPCEDCPLPEMLQAYDSHIGAPRIVKPHAKKSALRNYTCSLRLLPVDDGVPSCLSIILPTVGKAVIPPLRDKLTNIFSYEGYERKGNEVLKAAKQEQRNVAVIAMKVEGLRSVNALSGYKQGDSMLKNIIQLLNRRLPEETFFARLRSNDFVIIYPMNKGIHEPCDQELDAIRTSLKDVCFAVKTLRPSVFRLLCGLSLASKNGYTLENLLRKAQQSINTFDGDADFSFSLYNQRNMTELRQNVDLKRDLTGSLPENQFYLLYQPQYRLDGSKSLAGAETLIRWAHPLHGTISPARFIPLAEESRIILSIDQWVLMEACRQWRARVDSGLPAVPFAVNVSPQKFYEPGFTDFMDILLDRYNIPQGILEVELTESMALQHVDKAIQIMRKLQARGIWVAMDDFGTGYSSLGVLSRMPFNLVKVDRSFINVSHVNTESLRHLVSLMHSYGMQVVIEGVETQTQLELSREARFDIVQGYYTGKPMQEATFSKLLIRHRENKTLGKQRLSNEPDSHCF